VKAFIIFLVLFLSSQQLYANIQDTIHKSDSSFLHMYEHMRPPTIADTLNSISKYEFHQHNYQGLGELLGSVKGSTLQQLGDPILYSSISMFNSMASHLAISLNGIQMNSHFGNTANLYGIHPEAIHKAQLFVGSDAAILGGSAGPYVYLQENMYSTSTPFSRLWYIQGGYDLIGSEGLLTQNIDTNLNIHGSFRRLSSGGMLQNAGSDIWNTRLGIRYAPTNDMHYSFQWLFSNHGAYHNGGVIGEYQNPITANLLFDEYFQRQFSHQLQFNITSKSPFFNTDHLFIQAVYQDEQLETRGVNPYFYKDTSLVQLSPSQRYGIQARHEMPNIIDGLSFINEIGIMYGTYTFLDSYTNDEVLFHAYTYGNYEIVTHNFLRFGIRYSQSSAGTTIHPGISLTSKLSTVLSMKFDFSHTAVLPSIIQRTLLSVNQTEQHQLSFVSIDYTDASFAISVQPFHRRIESPQLFEILYDTSGIVPKYSGMKPLSQSSATSIGVHINSHWSQGPLALHASMQYVNTNQEYRYTPTLQARVNAEYSLYFGASTVTFGCTARMISEPMTMRYVPHISNFTHDSMMGSMQDISWNGLDMHISAILGNARIRASFMNVLSATLMDVSGYPIQDNIIRLSLNWSFFD